MSHKMRINCVCAYRLVRWMNDVYDEIAMDRISFFVSLNAREEEKKMAKILIDHSKWRFSQLLTCLMMQPNKKKQKTRRRKELSTQTSLFE